MSLENPGGQRSWRGGQACECMVLTVEDIVEPRLRAAGYLGQGEYVPVFQYAYNSSVSASAGTHGAGGALDHRKGSDGETKIWRECGVADWQRGDPHDQAFDDHNHGIWQGCPHTSGDADGQLVQYESGCNGLADWGPDQSPSVPPISWQDAYRKYAQPEPTGVLGMSKPFSMRRSDDWRIPAQTDGWDKAFPLNDDGDATAAADTGDDVLVVTASLTVTGMKDGESIDVAWAIVDCRASDGGDAKWPTKWAARRDPRRAVAGDSGYRTVETTFVGTLGKPSSGRSKRLRLVYQTASKTAVLGSLTVEGGR